MKITDKKKGLEDYPSKYNTVPDDLPPPEFPDEFVAEMEAEIIDTRRIQRRNARSQKKWEEEGQKNLKIIRDVPNAVSERLAHILKEKKIEVATFAREVGMGRTTIHRYLKGDPISSEKKLLRIIDALSMSVADFCYSPYDIEEWKASLEDSEYEKNDIFVWRDKLIEELSTNDFTYQRYGKTYRLPYNYYMVLKAVVENSIKFLDLLPHDTREWKPKKVTSTPAEESSSTEETKPESEDK